MTERPRIALRQPRSLQPEQMGVLTVSTPAIPQRVHAWILWEDGVEELVQVQAVAWTKRTVRVRFGAPPHRHEVWVWAGAVEENSTFLARFALPNASLPATGHTYRPGLPSQ